MHKFIDNIVAFSLKNKFFIFFCTVIADRCLSGCNEYKSDDHHAMGGP